MQELPLSNNMLPFFLFDLLGLEFTLILGTECTEWQKMESRKYNEYGLEGNEK